MFIVKVVTRPRSDVTTIDIFTEPYFEKDVVTRPRSDVTTIIMAKLVNSAFTVVTRPRSDVTTMTYFIVLMLFLRL